MTLSTIDAAVAKLSASEAKVLALYASGETLDMISQKASTKRAEVDRIVMQVANFNAQHARELAVAWQRKNNPGVIGQAAPPQPESPATAKKPVPVKAAPAPAPVEPIADLIGRAIASNSPKLIRLADRIQDLVDELERQVEEHDRGAALRAEEQRLQERLAEIRRQLGGNGSSSVKKPAADNKAIREWAERNGVSCPARGRVPVSVADAYAKAVRS